MHLPVLLNEVIDHLDLGSGDVTLDATLGGGGHAIEILKRIAPAGTLLAIEKDPETIEITKKRLEEFEENIIYVNDDFRNIDTILKENNIERIDGAIFDLGVSSFQLDEGRKGFSFLREGPLDMRFNTEQKLSAKVMVNSFGKEELASIIKEYGEERYSRRVAEAICSSRKIKEIETTGELTDVIVGAVGRKYRNQKLHPAARTFQALRIFVNDELAAVEEAVTKTIGYLSGEARICVISFHSLEDRIIKNVFRSFVRSGELNLLTKKPITPGREEIRQNARSRSAKLRVAERL